MMGILSAILMFVLVVPILVYHFLVFPNFDGIAQDLTFYKYDTSSQHFLYWAGFWTIAILSGFGFAITSSKKEKD